MANLVQELNESFLKLDPLPQQIVEAIELGTGKDRGSQGSDLLGSKAGKSAPRLHGQRQLDASHALPCDVVKAATGRESS